jgi:hypothetical protein
MYLNEISEKRYASGSLLGTAAVEAAYVAAVVAFFVHLFL